MKNAACIPNFRFTCDIPVSGTPTGSASYRRVSRPPAKIWAVPKSATRYMIPLSLLFLLVANTFGQSPKDKLSDIINQISASNVYEMSVTVGFAGSSSKQLERFNKLVSIATAEQLISLAESDSSAVVRLYAFQALRQQNVMIPADVQLLFSQDTSIVKTVSGCMMKFQTVKSLAWKNLPLRKSDENDTPVKTVD